MKFILLSIFAIGISAQLSFAATNGEAPKRKPATSTFDLSQDQLKTMAEGLVKTMNQFWDAGDQFHHTYTSKVKKTNGDQTDIVVHRAPDAGPTMQCEWTVSITQPTLSVSIPVGGCF